MNRLFTVAILFALMAANVFAFGDAPSGTRPKTTTSATPAPIAAEAKAAPAVAQPPAALYILAPDAKSAESNNLLPVEAALRAAAIDLAARGAYVVYVPVDQLASLPRAAYPRLTLEWAGSDPKPAWEATFSKSAAASEILCHPSFALDSWGSLVSSSTDACSQILKSVEGKIKLAAAPAPATLDPAGQKLIDAAFSRICGDGPAQTLDAAQAIDKVLSAHPSSADALRAAVWPGALFGSLDLHGYLQLRDRYLAVGLGWWIAANRVSPPKDARTLLTEAWLMLLCGFPKETLSVLGGLDKDAASQPLAKALRMYATRDFRPLDNDAVQRASAIEQLAYIWAIQDCNLFEGRSDTVMTIARARESSAFGPIQAIFGVGEGHQFGQYMASVSSLYVLATITDMAALPALERQTLAGEAQSAPKSRMGPADLWPGMDTAQAMRLFNKALVLALHGPDGPVRSADGKIVWQSLSPWAYAQVEGGFAYQAIHLYGYFLARMWGVPDSAIPFLKNVTAGCDANPGMASFFRILAEDTERHTAPGETYANLFATELGRQPQQWGLLGDWARVSYLDTMRKHENVVHHPCGAWEAEMCLIGCDKSKVDKDKTGWYRCVAANDQYNRQLYLASTYEKPDKARTAEIADRAPYDYGLLQSLAWRAQADKDYDQAVDLYTRCIKSDPSNIYGYRSLGSLYEAQGEIDKAIEILKEGCGKSEFTVAAGSTMSWVARLLLKQGKVDDALDWAKKGSETYSSTGLTTYGLALIKSGKVDEGLDYFRQDAERYPTGSFDYLTEMFISGKPHEKVISEAKRLAEMHKDKHIQEWFVSALACHGEFAAATEMMAGAGLNGARQEKYLAVFALIDGRIKEAVEHFRSLMEENYIERYGRDDAPMVAMWAYLSALLGQDEELKEGALAYFPTCKLPKGEVTPLVEYFTHKATRVEALQHAKGYNNTIFNLYWVYGVEAEASGDRAKALEYYKLASACEKADWVYGGYCVRKRMKALEEKSSPKP